MITTVDDLIETLGGLSAVANVGGVGPTAVCNWRDRGRIPSNHFFAISEAVEAVGEKVSPLVFGFKAKPRGRA